MEPAAQKLKIDQYIMHGGKLLWAVDNLYASMDSLQRSSGSFVAFDMGLELDEQLFKYGVRITRDLLQDLECDKVPSVIGSIGDKPQIELLPWPYAPLLRNTGDHPISKNLDFVLSSFPQTIDTVAAPGIRKQVILGSSSYSPLAASLASYLNSSRFPKLFALCFSFSFSSNTSRFCSNCIFISSFLISCGNTFCRS